MNKIKDIGRGVINLVFPPRCPVCDGIIGPVERYIHSRCCEKLFPVEQPQCMRCGKPVLSERREYCDDCARALEHHRQMREDDSYRQGKALFAYKGSIKQTMYRFKYSNRREYAAYFAQTAVERYPVLPDVVPPVIEPEAVPVPSVPVVPPPSPFLPITI